MGDVVSYNWFFCVVWAMLFCELLGADSPTIWKSWGICQIFDGYILFCLVYDVYYNLLSYQRTYCYKYVSYSMEELWREWILMRQCQVSKVESYRWIRFARNVIILYNSILWNIVNIVNFQLVVNSATCMPLGTHQVLRQFVTLMYTGIYRFFRFYDVYYILFPYWRTYYKK